MRGQPSFPNHPFVRSMVLNMWLGYSMPFQPFGSRRWQATKRRVEGWYSKIEQNKTAQTCRHHPLEVLWESLNFLQLLPFAAVCGRGPCDNLVHRSTIWSLNGPSVNYHCGVDHGDWKAHGKGTIFGGCLRLGMLLATYFCMDCFLPQGLQRTVSSLIRQESYSPIDELAEPQGTFRGSLPIIKRTVLGILMLSALWLTSDGPSVWGLRYVRCEKEDAKVFLFPIEVTKKIKEHDTLLKTIHPETTTKQNIFVSHLFA